MPGPPRQPTKLKRIKGTLNTTRTLDNELTFKPLEALPGPPKDFNKKMVKLWFACCSSLISFKLLFAQDLPLLEQYVFSIHMVRWSQEQVLKLGAIKSQTNKGGFEYQAKNKWSSINLEYSKEATRLGREFGFTPSARTQIGVNYSPTSELDKIMFGD